MSKSLQRVGWQLGTSLAVMALCFVAMELHRSQSTVLLDVEYGRSNEKDLSVTDRNVNDVVSNTGITVSVNGRHSVKKPVSSSADDEVIMNFKQIETAALKDLRHQEASFPNKGRTMTLHEEHEYSGLHKAGVNTGEGPGGTNWDSHFISSEHAHPKGKKRVGSNGKLKSAGVNTGEESDSWLDETVEPKDKMPAGLFEEQHTLKQHTQPSSAEAGVDSVSKLETMGVNTGERHRQWNDAIAPAEDIKEGAYQFGVTHKPIPEPKAEKEAEEDKEEPSEAEGEEAEGEEAEGEEPAEESAEKAVILPQLRGDVKSHMSAHKFFQTAAVEKAAAPYLKEVSSVAKRAEAVASRAAAKEEEARQAVKADGILATMARAVAQAKVQARKFEDQVAEKEREFASQLKRAQSILPSSNLKPAATPAAAVKPAAAATKKATGTPETQHAPAANLKSARKAVSHVKKQDGEVAALTMAAEAFPHSPHLDHSRKAKHAQSKNKLDTEVAADRAENKALSGSADLDGFLSAVNTKRTAHKATHPNLKHSHASAPVSYAPKKKVTSLKGVSGPAVNLKREGAVGAGLAAQREGMRLKGKTKTQGLAIRASYLCSFSFWGMKPLCPSPAAHV